MILWVLIKGALMWNLLPLSLLGCLASSSHINTRSISNVFLYTLSTLHTVLCVRNWKLENIIHYVWTEEEENGRSIHISKDDVEARQSPVDWSGREWGPFSWTQLNRLPLFFFHNFFPFLPVHPGQHRICLSAHSISISTFHYRIQKTTTTGLQETFIDSNQSTAVPSQRRESEIGRVQER